ncbi:MAG: endonuclease/exonuclease/phosphatase family protein [Pirellulaceae bacterium]|nr:endonuclease/exonuclease/phosphatase family protein [Pirellulaceae bacterium]
MDQPLHHCFRLKFGMFGLFSTVGTVAVGATLAGLAGRYIGVLDLASHFPVQYLATLSIVAAAMSALRAYRTATVFAVVALVNLVLVLQVYTGSPPALGPHGRSLRALLINVHSDNTDHTAVLASIKRHAPDFVLVQEVNQRWSEALQAIEDRYQYVVDQPQDDNFGIVLLGKYTALDAEVFNVGGVRVPSILAEFEIEGRRFFIRGTHTIPPLSSKYAEMRDQHLAALPDIIVGLDAPVLLLGDLNTSPWSYHFKKLIRTSGLRNASRGRGIQATWPTQMLPLLIPIDHCLYSSGIEIIDKTIADPIASDHYPVIVDFAISLGPQSRM